MSWTNQPIWFAMSSKDKTRPNGCAGRKPGGKVVGDRHQPPAAGLGLGNAELDKTVSQVHLRPVQSLQFGMAQTGEGADGQPGDYFRPRIPEDQAQLFRSEDFDVAFIGHDSLDSVQLGIVAGQVFALDGNPDERTRLAAVADLDGAKVRDPSPKVRVAAARACPALPRLDGVGPPQAKGYPGII